MLNRALTTLMGTMMLMMPGLKLTAVGHLDQANHWGCTLGGSCSIMVALTWHMVEAAVLAIKSRPLLSWPLNRTKLPQTRNGHSIMIRVLEGIISISRAHRQTSRHR